MNIAVIGIGNVGKTFGEIWATKGHSVAFGVRDPESEKAELLKASIGKKALVASVEEAVANAEVVLLAVPWANALETVKALGGFAGKIVIDPINSFTPELQLSIAQGTSVAEEIAKAAPDAKVVKAFNTLGVDNVKNLRFGDQTASGFLCGDDPSAKAKVARLAEEAGFEVVDCGPLRNARALESLALLWGQLAFAFGRGPQIAFKLLHR